MNMNTKPKTLLAALRRIPVGAWVALVLSAGVSLASEPGHRAVTGRLVAPPDRHWNLSETKGMLQEQLPPFPIPPEVKAKGRNAEDEWFQMWKTTEEARAFFDRPRRKHDVSVSSDGSFAIEKVVPGDYWLFYTLPDSVENEPVSMGHKAFSLSPGAAPWALGEIRMTVLPHLDRGERAPEFEVRALDGTSLNLDSCKGKVVFLHFWSTECAACLAEMPEIKKTHSELGDTSGFIMLGLNLDEDRQKARDYIARKKLVWPQALLGSWKHKIMRDFHVLGIPSNLLLDSQGRVVAKNLRHDQLSREIRRCLADVRAPGGSGGQPPASAAR